MTHIKWPVSVSLQLNEPTVEMAVKSRKSEAKSVVWRHVMQEWKKRWDTGSTGRHLYQIKKEVLIVGGHRKAETVITRLRPGHNLLKKTLCLIWKHGTGQCEVCQEEEESVEHVVLRSRAYDACSETMKKG